MILNTNRFHASGSKSHQTKSYTDCACSTQWDYQYHCGPVVFTLSVILLDFQENHYALKGFAFLSQKVVVFRLWRAKIEKTAKSDSETFFDQNRAIFVWLFLHLQKRLNKPLLRTSFRRKWFQSDSEELGQIWCLEDLSVGKQACQR